MEDPSKNDPPPEKDSIDAVRAKLRAAGLYRNLEPPKKSDSARFGARDNVVVPFRRPASLKKQVGWNRKVASVLYILLLAAAIVLVWH